MLEKARFDRKLADFILTDEDLVMLKQIYAGVDVDRELRNMKAWLLSPRGQRRKGTGAFIVNWLNKLKPAYKAEVRETAIPQFMEHNLEELWKDKTDLLDQNKKA